MSESNGNGASTAALVSRLRAIAQQNGATATSDIEHCEVCGTELDPDHRHLLHIEERRIICACEPCIAMRIGDGPYRPTGTRVVWLDDFEMPEDLWARLAIPIGLAFFMQSSSVDGVAGLYPSPAGATECELDLGAWEELCEQNPLLADLEVDAEALVIDRISEPNRCVIAPIDECYRLVGMVKANWEGISGGGAVERALPQFFAELRERTPEHEGQLMEAREGVVSEPAVRRDRPRLRFEVRNVTPIARAAALTLRFELAIDEGTEREIFTIALSVSIEIEPAQRRYDAETRERLVELLGDPAKIGAPTRTMHWTRLGVLVPAFAGSTTVGVDVLCNYDLEIGATSYFHTVRDGEVPLAFNFNGNVYYQGDDGRLQIVQVDWDSHASFQMPVTAWKQMIELHYPYRDWIALHSETREALRRFRAQRGLPTFDATIETLLREAGDGD